ncbi:MAG: class I SAM-dependent methyltransferase [Magnetospirillum gryphiswaldense]|nr:class I SAM-dependent methyltransferase [Magnetospirillum gryphiswaldense]
MTESPLSKGEIISFWNSFAVGAPDERGTHRDQYQLALETAFAKNALSADSDVLEVGCGNGYMTERLAGWVRSVDGFDPAAEMVANAQRIVAAKNCRFFVKGLPDPEPTGLKDLYDAVVSVRVLINLPGHDSQAQALRWIASRLKPGGRYIFIEGADEGICNLNDLRTKAGIEPINVVPHNLNFNLDWLKSSIQGLFKIVEQRHTGMYDYLTRYFYPVLLKGQEPKYNTEFHEAAYRSDVAGDSDPRFAAYTRLHLLVLEKI